MTLIIGVLCSDGIVMCADGATTTNIKDSSKKIYSIQNKFLLGTAGSMGMSQKFANVLETDNAFANVVENSPAYQAMTELEAKVNHQAQPAFQAFLNFNPGMNAQAFQALGTSTLVAYYGAGELRLFSVTTGNTSIKATTDRCTLTVGSGSQFANPFLKFLKQCWFGNAPIPLKQGRLLAIICMKHVIDVMPGGVSDPIQLAEIRQENGNWTIFNFEDGDVDAHQEQAAAFTEYVQKYAETFDDVNDADDLPEA